jgi:hypothetical protein
VTRRSLLALALAALVVAPTSCSSHAKSRPAAATSTTVGPLRALSVKTYEYSYDVGQLTPLRVAAGRVTVSAQDAGGEAHEARFVQLLPGVTVAAVVAGLQRDPSGASLTATVTSAGGTGAIAPGASGRAVLHLVPGSYLMFCGLRAPDGAPHFAKGMLLPFTVE